jgi:hypothetical protein
MIGKSGRKDVQEGRESWGVWQPKASGTSISAYAGKWVAAHYIDGRSLYRWPLTLYALTFSMIISPELCTSKMIDRLLVFSNFSPCHRARMYCKRSRRKATARKGQRLVPRPTCLLLLVLSPTINSRLRPVILIQVRVSF